MLDANERSGTRGSAERETNAAVFANMYRGLRRFAAAVGAPSGDPDDLVQEALCRTLGHCQLAELENPEAYLKRAMVNIARNGWRQAGRASSARLRNRDEEALADSYPSDIEHLLGGEDPITRACLLLVDVDGMSYREAGELLGRSAVGLRSRASRARRRIRLCLEDDDDAR